MKLIRAEEAARNPERYYEGYPNMLYDDKVAIITRRDLDRLPEYSSSVPTGVCEGKVWKRIEYRTPDGAPALGRHEGGETLYFLGSFDPDPQKRPGIVIQRFRELLVVD